MTLIDKIKLALTLQKDPGVQELIGEAKDIKRGWKTLHFWVTVLGSAVSALAAFNGLLSPLQTLIISTILVALYNISRGVEKSQEDGTRPWYQSTETLVGILQTLLNAAMSLQAGGITGPELAFAQTMLAGAMAIARDLSHLQPTTPSSIPPQAPTETSIK